MKAVVMKTSMGLAALMVAGWATTAEAASLCVPGPNSDGLSVSDVTLGGLNATNCYGLVTGNNSNQDINELGDGALKFNGNAWGGEVKHDIEENEFFTGSFYGVQWTIEAEEGVNGGYTLSFIDSNPSALPFLADVLIVLKGGNDFAGYLFDDFLFDTSNQSGEYTMYFSENGKSGKTSQKGLSHISVYFRDGLSYGDPQPDPDPVPEPASLVLLGAGLLGLGAGAARRRARQ